jgi:hypothetical protein
MNATQPSLFGIPQAGTFDSVVDGPRTNSQRAQIEALMNDGKWRTLAAIVAHVGGVSDAGASARLRDLRKKQYGSRTVERRRIEEGSGLYLYRVVPR